MALRSLFLKMDYVRGRINARQEQRLEALFVELQKTFQEGSMLSMGACRSAFFDLTYALIKHAEWHKTPIFKDFLVEFLQKDHRIPASSSQEIVECLLGVFSNISLCRERTICIDDREFLTYVYATTANHKRAADACEELGLGHSILAKLHDGVDVIQRGETDRYVPEYDAMLASILVELAHHSRKRASYIAEQRLKFRLLSQLGDNAVPWILEDRLPMIFDRLVAVGQSLAGLEVLNLNESDLFLVGSGFLIAEKIARTRRTRLTLSTVSAELTADYACQALTDERQTIAQTLHKLPLSWQLSLVRDVSFFGIDQLALIVTDLLSKLPPQVTELAIERIVRESTTAIGAETIKSLLSSSRLPWHKAAVLRAIADVTPSDEIASAVAESLEGDLTESIKQAAQSLVERWNEKGSYS